MKYNDVMSGFDSLSAAEKVRFLSEARTMMAYDNAALRRGSKVQFKSKHGFIAGVFVRAKRKNAEVTSVYDRYGTKSQYGTVRWSVPMAALIPLTPSQVSMFEFPNV
jgi:hypothetical protein